MQFFLAASAFICNIIGFWVLLKAASSAILMVGDKCTLFFSSILALPQITAPLQNLIRALRVVLKRYYA
jgi:hypothetical protein